MCQSESPGESNGAHQRSRKHDQWENTEKKVLLLEHKDFKEQRQMFDRLLLKRER